MYASTRMAFPHNPKHLPDGHQNIAFVFSAIPYPPTFALANVSVADEHSRVEIRAKDKGLWSEDRNLFQALRKTIDNIINAQKTADFVKILKTAH